MKKTRVFFYSLLSAVILLCSSCTPFGNIFYEIMQDVPPEIPTVKGNIISIARYNISGTEYLFTTGNGGLRYKKADDMKHGSWEIYPELPFELHYYKYYPDDDGSNPPGHYGQQLIKVMADENNLYLVTVKYTTDYDTGTSSPEKFFIWTTALTLKDGNIDTSAEWHEVQINTNGEQKEDEVLYFYKNTNKSLYYTNFNVFSTNSPKPEHRKVFIRSTPTSGSVTKETKQYHYILNGATAEPYTPEYIIDKTDTGRLNNAAYIGEQIYFLESQAATTNETKTKSASYIYFAGNSNKAKLCYSNGSKNLDGTFDITETVHAGEPIASLAVCKDVILIGRADESYTYQSQGGITKTSLDENGIPGTSLESFSTNAASQLTNTYFINTLLNVDPSQTELDSILYASLSFIGSGSTSTGTSYAVSYEDIGLWSYYPERGNWNRE